jgi:predicted nuclease of restriction endonuclease-like (RecB) superfamily
VAPRPSHKAGSGGAGAIVLRFEQADPQTNRTDLTALCAAHGEVAFVDFSFGSTAGYVRFRSPEGAQAALAALGDGKTVIGGATPQWHLLSEEEEHAYREAVQQAKKRPRDERAAMAAQSAAKRKVVEEVKDPLVLEFLDLKDEYSESELEAALLRHLEHFLLELGGDFAFVGRQRRLRIGDQWFRVDLLFFHRKLQALVVIELKVGRLTHADAGQMHLYLNYAREHWTREGENPPVGLILCSEPDDALARYALHGLPNKVLARKYRLVLPTEQALAAELEQTRMRLERRAR